MPNEYTVSTANLTAIADAIREKTGGTAEITPENMAGEIRALPNTEDVTQAEYDGMASHDAGTYYFIVG